MPADENGVRIAYLDEMSYRRALWTHRPLTDFWRVGARICEETGRTGALHHGGYRQMLAREGDGLL